MTTLRMSDRRLHSPVHMFYAVKFPSSEVFLDEAALDLDRLLETDGLRADRGVALLVCNRAYPEASRSPSASDAALEPMGGQQAEEGVERAEHGDQSLVRRRVAQVR